MRTLLLVSASAREVGRHCHYWTVRFTNRGAHHAVGAVDRLVTTAVQAEENERGLRLSCANGNCLVGSPMDDRPTYHDAAIAQFAGPFFASLLVIFAWNMLMSRIHGMYELQGCSHLGSKVAGKRENIVRRLDRRHGAENASDRRSLAIAQKRVRPQNEYWAADCSKEMLGG